METVSCPLCRWEGAVERIGDQWGRWHSLCPACGLIFTDRAEILSLEAQRTRYEAHQNSPEHPGYVAFLRQAVTAAGPWLRRGLRALDYGCGPGPTMDRLLAEEGVDCALYDPLFAPEWPEGRFDVLFATEVVEHFIEPREDWRRMTALLNPGGVLVVMTERYTDTTHFPTWWYANDATHVAFYHARTLEWIAGHFGLREHPALSARVSLLSRE